MGEFLFWDGNYADDDRPEEQDPDLIRDHLYDCGPQEETGGPCLVVVTKSAFVSAECGRSRNEHERSEYPEDTTPAMDRARRGRGGRGGDLPPGKFERAVGDMHEPKPYTEELDWHNDGSELLHPFVD